MAGGVDKVACDGHCPCRRVVAQTAQADTGAASSGAQGVASGEMGRVDAESGRVAAAAVACPAIFMPVCGTDGASYSNEW